MEAMEKVREIEEKLEEEITHGHFKIKELREAKDKSYKEMEGELKDKIKALEEERARVLETLDYNKGKSANELIELEKSNEQKLVRVEAK
jgi:hypothetical protein